ncbi:MAG: hypothetical protein AAGI11_11920 [Pseudomonadota bacterium]
MTVFSLQRTRLPWIAVACLCLAACRIEIQVPTSGVARTESGSMVCTAGQTCSVSVNDIFFDETFIAQPADGFTFTGWSGEQRSLCGGSSEPCHLSTESFADSEALMQILEDPDEVYYLDPVFQSEGFISLFMGHSFFRPFAEGMPFHAERAGIMRHEQAVVSSGGATGSPEALWNNTSKRNEIQAILDRGNIELFAMTYHPDYPGLTGYRNWIDYAMAQNPETRIVIALPWLTNPATVTTDEYAFRSEQIMRETYEAGIDRLRQLYPETEIFGIPYGLGAVELRRLFDAGELPDVKVLTSKTEPAIYRDGLGHADDILVELGRLIWLRAIYGVDLNTYDYDPGYSTDLKALAQSVLDGEDPVYNALYR